MMRKLIMGALASAMFATVQAAELKSTLTQSAIVAQGEKPIMRTEIGLKVNPVEGYIVNESKGDSNYTKFRVQALPLHAGPFSLGASAQHVEITGVPELDSYGVVGRVAGKLGTNTFAKLDVRVLPEDNKAEMYAMIDTPHVFADLLGSYTKATDMVSLTPGIDVKTSKHTSVGVEGKFTGEPSKLEQSYLGIRAKVNF